MSAQIGELTPLKERREALEKLVNAFCVLRKPEFAKKRSRQFTFGKVAFKVSERIEFPEEFESVVIDTLRKLGHTDCVNVRESVDKQAAKLLEDNELARCGMQRKKDDNFRIEPNLQIISEMIGKSCPTAKLDLTKLAKLIPAPESAGEAPLKEKAA